jgi:hypothetical protein
VKRKKGDRMQEKGMQTEEGGIWKKGKGGKREKEGERK